MASSPKHEPVTVVARHTLAPGREAEFRAWVAGIVEECSRFEGYLGTEVVRPAGKGDHAYASIFRFDTVEHLDAWMQSPARASWNERARAFQARPSRVTRYEGLEAWFVPPRGSPPQAPPKHRMALVTFAVIWPMVHVIPPAIAALVPAPRLALEALAVGTIVLLMTWVVMPAVTRLLRPWLYG